MFNHSIYLVGINQNINRIKKKKKNPMRASTKQEQAQDSE